MEAAARTRNHSAPLRYARARAVVGPGLCALGGRAGQRLYFHAPAERQARRKPAEPAPRLPGATRSTSIILRDGVCVGGVDVEPSVATGGAWICADEPVPHLEMGSDSARCGGKLNCHPEPTTGAVPPVHAVRAMGPTLSPERGEGTSACARRRRAQRHPAAGGAFRPAYRNAGARSPSSSRKRQGDENTKSTLGPRKGVAQRASACVCTQRGPARTRQ